MLLLIICLISTMFLVKSTEIYDQFPYMVSLRNKKSNNHFCGGAILNHHWIATAAHCFASRKIQEIFASVGSLELHAGGTSYDVGHIIVNEQEIQNDIALLQTRQEIVFQYPLVDMIPFTERRVRYGSTVRLIGFGSISRTKSIAPSELQYLDMTIMVDCPIDSTNPAYFCANGELGTGQASCYGDSGSPLVHSGRLVGLVSLVAKNSTDECIAPTYFVNVPYFYEWIKSVIYES